MSAPPLTPVLSCADLARSVRFYTDILGFAVTAGGADQAAAWLDRDGAVLVLERAVAAPEYPAGRGLSLRVAADDTEALYASVQAYGARIHRPLAGTPRPEFSVMDPDGYLLCFAQAPDQPTPGAPPPDAPPPDVLPPGARSRPAGLLGRLRLATRDGIPQAFADAAPGRHAPWRTPQHAR